MRLSQPFIDAQPWPLLRIDEVVSDDRSLESRIRQEAAVVDRALEGTHTLLLPSTQGYECKSKTLRFGWVRHSPPSTSGARYFCRHRCRRIFSGETFSAYINISNASNLQAVNVIVQVGRCLCLTLPISLADCSLPAGAAEGPAAEDVCFLQGHPPAGFLTLIVPPVSALSGGVVDGSEARFAFRQFAGSRSVSQRR